MSEEVLETAGQYRVRLEVDQDSGSFNPRKDYDHVTYAVTVPDSHYMDVPESGPLSEGWDRIKDRSDAVDVFTGWARIFHGAVVELHTPERGPKSVWYILPEQIAEIGGTPEEALRADIQEYQNWADGEVYAYIIEKSVEWKRTDGEDETQDTWEQVEDGSCGGYIGYDWAVQSAKEEFAAYMKQVTLTAIEGAYKKIQDALEELSELGENPTDENGCALDIHGKQFTLLGSGELKKNED